MPRAKGERRLEILKALAHMLEAPKWERITTAALAEKLEVSEAARHGGRGYGKPRRRAIALLDRLPAPVRQERLREEAHRELQRPAPLPALIRDRPRFQAGWNSSIGLPSGSSSWICFPPGPDSISLRKLKPCCFIAATRAGRSTTSTTNRFHPPGSCRRPSDIGLAPELPG